MLAAFVTHPDCNRHEMGPGHPECPERLAAIQDRLLAAGRCPRCRYEIDQVPAEGDGCAVCPECGAAWRVAGGNISAVTASEDSAASPPATPPPRPLA